MKKIVLLVWIAIAAVCEVHAQKEVRYQESQTRVIEPLQDVYVRPLVVDLEVIKEDRQVYGPFPEILTKDITEISSVELDNAKKNAVYKAAIMDDADVIVAATFDVRTPDKGKGVIITVRGYPAKYVHWRKVTDKGKDPVTGETVNDYDWLENSLFEGLRIRSITQGAADKKTEAVGGRK